MNKFSDIINLSKFGISCQGVLVNSEILKRAEKFTNEILGNNSSGHDFGHCLRVQNIAMDIASQYNCDKNLVALSALLHDIDDEKIFGDNGHKHLIEFCKLNHIDLICKDKMIAIIDFLSLDKKDNSVSIETKIVQDADNLDALGAIGLARMFAFGGANGKVLYDASNNDSFSHFYQRLIKLPELMNTTYAKEEAVKRLNFMRKFIEQFKSEIHQGDYNG